MLGSSFQSTRPVRGATMRLRTPLMSSLFQSTRPVRGATLRRVPAGAGRGVSIHAPRAGRDSASGSTDWRGDVSIHAPRAGRDIHASSHVPAKMQFQSTRPVRGATYLKSVVRRLCKFQSTRPVRGATWRPPSWACRRRRFNPRAPCGARPWAVAQATTAQWFQSTRPVRGATALRASDRDPTRFQSTRPVRGATATQSRMSPLTLFQSTRPVRGATVSSKSFSSTPHAFQSTRPVRGATREL